MLLVKARGIALCEASGIDFASHLKYWKRLSKNYVAPEGCASCAAPSIAFIEALSANRGCKSIGADRDDSGIAACKCNQGLIYRSQQN